MQLAAPVTIELDDLRRHLLLLGRTGTGKSTLQRALVYSFLRSGLSFTLVDPLGGLAESVVDAVPPELNDRVVYWDAGDLNYPIGFNVLDRVPEDQHPLVADQINSAISHIWDLDLSSAPRLLYINMNAVRLLLYTPGSSLLGLQRLLVDRAYREFLLRNCKDDVVSGYWRQEFGDLTDRQATEMIGAVQNKIGLLLTPVLRRIVGQTRSTIDIRRLMNSGGSLIARFAKGAIGTTASYLLGSLLATKIAQVAEERAAQSNTEWPDHALIADEFQNLATDNFSSTLAEARNGKLFVVLATQYLAAIPPSVKASIFANCGNLVIFRCGAPDADEIGEEMGFGSKRVLCDTENFRAWAKLLQNGNPTDPLFLTTHIPTPPASGRKAAVIAHTRARHTRERAHVEALIAKQLEPITPPRRQRHVKHTSPTDRGASFWGGV